MTRSRFTLDEQLRRYALENLRSVVSRMRYTDLEVELRGEWRQDQLIKAARWAAIAEALRPDPVSVELEVNES